MCVFLWRCISAALHCLRALVPQTVSRAAPHCLYAATHCLYPATHSLPPAAANCQSVINGFLRAHCNPANPKAAAHTPQSPAQYHFAWPRAARPPRRLTARRPQLISPTFAARSPLATLHFRWRQETRAEGGLVLVCVQSRWRASELQSCKSDSRPDLVPFLDAFWALLGRFLDAQRAPKEPDLRATQWHAPIMASMIVIIIIMSPSGPVGDFCGQISACQPDSGREEPPKKGRKFLAADLCLLFAAFSPLRLSASLSLWLFGSLALRLFGFPVAQLCSFRLSAFGAFGRRASQGGRDARPEEKQRRVERI